MKPAREERHLFATMFKDMVGHRRLTRSNERLAPELLEEHKRVLRSLLPIHGGTEIKTVGDAFLAELRRARESVRAYTLLFMYAALGDLDEAFGNLMRAAEIHSWPAHIKHTPVFSKLRKDPRFQEFCRMVGLSP